MRSDTKVTPHTSRSSLTLTSRSHHALTAPSPHPHLTPSPHPQYTPPRLQIKADYTKIKKVERSASASVKTKVTPVHVSPVFVFVCV